MDMPTKSSFGPVPDEVHARIYHTLNALEERQTARIKPSIVVFAAMCVMILATTAYAVFNRAGLREFYEKWRLDSGYVHSDVYTRKGGLGNEAIATGTVKDMIVTVTEAASNGEQYFVCTTVSLKDGADAHLINLDSLSNGVAYAPLFKNDSPTYLVSIEIISGDGGSITYDWIDNEDGSISFFCDPLVMLDGDVSRMGCMITYAYVDDGVPPTRDQFTTELVDFEGSA